MDGSGGGGRGGGGFRKATPKGQMSGSGMGPAITYLPYHLKSLFEPNPPIEYIPPAIKRKMPPYTGLNSVVNEFEVDEPPQRQISETPRERKERIRKDKAEIQKLKLEKDIAAWNPHEVKAESVTEDAYKTLFVGRISYETTERQLRREFERYGDINKIRLVEDEDGKPMGYAFIEYMDESAMKSAFKNADGKKIDGRRIVVDVERGRTVRDWKPRKLGGGIGETRAGGADVNVKYSGRESIRGYGQSSRDIDRPRSRSRGRDGDSRDRRDSSSRYGPSSNDRPRSRSRGRSRERRAPPSGRRSRSRSRGRDRSGDRRR